MNEAVLGAAVEIPTLDGRATVSVPPGTQGGGKLRLRGKGIPAHRKRPAGDLIATIRIAIPTKLDDAARAALDALAACDDPDLRSRLAR